MLNYSLGLCSLPSTGGFFTLVQAFSKPLTPYSWCGLGVLAMTGQSNQTTEEYLFSWNKLWAISRRIIWYYRNYVNRKMLYFRELILQSIEAFLGTTYLAMTGQSNQTTKEYLCFVNKLRVTTGRSIWYYRS